MKIAKGFLLLLQSLPLDRQNKNPRIYCNFFNTCYNAYI